MKVVDSTGLADVFNKVKEAIVTGADYEGFNGTVIPLTQEQYDERKANGQINKGTMYPIIDEEIW